MAINSSCNTLSLGNNSSFLVKLIDCASSEFLLICRSLLFIFTLVIIMDGLNLLKAMLSGYANPIYKPLEHAGWERHDFDTRMGSGKNRDRVESVWLKKSESAVVAQEVRGAFSLGDLWDWSDFFIDPVPTIPVSH